MKMDEEILTFVDVKNEKSKFYRCKSTAVLKDVDIQKVLVSNKISSGEKYYEYFIGYMHNDYKAVTYNASKKSAYVKGQNGQTKQMYLLIAHDDLLEKHNTVWDKVSADIKKEFDSEPVYNKKFLKTKIKPYGNEIDLFLDNDSFYNYIPHFSSERSN